MSEPQQMISKRQNSSLSAQNISQQPKTGFYRPMKWSQKPINHSFY